MTNNKLDVQIANIRAMLEQLLKQQPSSPHEDEEKMGCPSCGCDNPEHGGPKGRGLIVTMVSKKKLKPGQGPDFPPILKDILGALSGKSSSKKNTDDY